MIRCVNTLQQHEISESSHRILNAFTDEKLMLLGEICRLRPGQQQLDLASGKGEMLCRWAERFGTGGLGVDISDVFVPAARARATELGVDDRVRFVHADASTFVAEPAAYDVVSCGPSVPLVTPLPSGSGVTGMNSSRNRVRRPNIWSFSVVNR